MDSLLFTCRAASLLLVLVNANIIYLHSQVKDPRSILGFSRPLMSYSQTIPAHKRLIAKPFPTSYTITDRILHLKRSLLSLEYIVATQTSQSHPFFSGRLLFLQPFLLLCMCQSHESVSQVCKHATLPHCVLVNLHPVFRNTAPPPHMRLYPIPYPTVNLLCFGSVSAFPFRYELSWHPSRSVWV